MPFDNTEVMNQLKNAVDWCWDLRVAARGSLKTKAAAIEQRANLGDFGADITIDGRDALLALDPYYKAALKARLDPVIRNIFRLAGFPGDLDIEQNWNIAYQHLEKNNLTFKARVPTYATLPDDLTKSGKGASSAIVGDSTILRLTKDRYGNSLDGGHAASIEVECIGDKTTGFNEFSERFRYRYNKGRTVFDDPPEAEQFFANLVNNGGGILKDHSFHIGDEADENPESLGTNWVDDAGNYSTNYKVLDDPIYRPAQGSELGKNKTPLALEFENNTTLYQEITDSLSLVRPYLPGVMAYRNDACDKTLTLSVGATDFITHDFDDGSHDDGEWLLLTPTIDEKLWLHNFTPLNGDPLKFQLAMSQGGGSNIGTPVFDNSFLIPGTFFNGGYIWHIPGKVSHVVEDKLVWTDAAPSDPGKISTIVLEAYDRVVPVDASPTVTDPA